MMLTVYIKGLCEPNPDGHMAWAFIAVEGTTGEVLERQLGAVPPPAITGQKRATNYVAEYGALIKALEWLTTQRRQPVTLYTSLSGVVSRMSGTGQTYEDTMTERVFAKAYALAAGLAVTWAWVATPQNPANPLAQAAYRDAAGRPPTDWHRRHTPPGGHAA